MSEYTNLDKNTTLKELTYEIWKRILNNLPYLYKTKGTKRGLQALLTCYGIPSSILRIKEFGGPDVNYENITEYTFDNFSYALDFSASFVSIPWVTSSNQYPQSVEFRFLTTTIPDNSMSLVEVNDNSEIKWGIEVVPTTLDKGKINFKILSDTNQYSSVSTSEMPLFDGNFNSVVIQRTSQSDNNVDQVYELYVKKYLYEQIFYYDSKTLNINETSGNIGWVCSNSYFNIGGNSIYTNDYIGSMDEIRFWNCNLNERTIDKHIKHPSSILSNNITSSYNDLVLRLTFNNPINLYSSTSGSLTNDAVSQLYPTQSMQIYGFANSAQFPYNYTGYNYFSTIHFSNIGGQRWANKIRIESASLNGVLQHDKRIEINEYDNSLLDSNKVGVYFSPTTPVDENIIEFFGIDNIGDFMGNPSHLYSSSYTDLDILNKLYWSIYSRNITVSDYLLYIRRYDKSLFDNIKKFIPGRAKPILGLVYEPHILERNKVKYSKPIIENLTHESYITSSIIFNSQITDINDIIHINEIINLSDSTADNLTGSYNLNNNLIINNEITDFIGNININNSFNDITSSIQDLQAIIKNSEIYEITSSNFEKYNIYNIIIDLSVDSTENQYFYLDKEVSTKRFINIGSPNYSIINREEIYRMPSELIFFDYFNETFSNSCIYTTILPYVNFEYDNNIFEGSGSIGFNSSVYQIYNYSGRFTGSLGIIPSGSGYSKYHYKWFRNSSTAEKRLKYEGCKNTINTTFDLKEPIETWQSNPNDITSDDINNSFVTVR